jgi:hypothetical protein
MASSLWARALASLPEEDQQIFHVSSNPPPNTSQILDDILSALEAQRDRCKRDRWKIAGRDGKSIVIRDVCAKIATYVTKFMGVVDVVVNFDPVHAALPWAGVRFVLQLCLTAFDAFDAIVEGLERATGLIARSPGVLEALTFRHSSCLSDAEKALEEDMLKLYGSVLGFLCKAKKHYDRSLASKSIEDVPISISRRVGACSL